MSQASVRKVVDPAVRRQVIAGLVSESHESYKEFKFRFGHTSLTLIHVPVTHLIYRLANYRTRDRQLDEIARKGLSGDFFDERFQEDAAVQQAQHDILVIEAERGKGESVKPIIEVLKESPQTDQLIITSNGVVVNGNRRLAAMRELLASEGTQYGSFKLVRAAVLPDSTTLKEIRELEIALQMQPDTKLPYDWTAIGRAARDLRVDGMKDEEIEKLMDRDLKDVNRAINKMEQAEIYLQDWLGKPNYYSELDETEQAFNQIAIKNASQKDPVLKEATRAADFFVIEYRGLLEDRAYSYINTIEGNAELFLTQLAEAMGISLGSAETQGKLKILFEDEGQKEKNFAPVIDQLRKVRENKESAKDVVETVEKICTHLEELKKHTKSAAIRFVRDAHRALKSVDLASAALDTLPDITANLEQIEEMTRTLWDQAQGIRNQNSNQ
jgi:hypothetical protein